jgi:hypothetical protein
VSPPDAGAGAAPRRPRPGGAPPESTVGKTPRERGQIRGVLPRPAGPVAGAASRRPGGRAARLRGPAARELPLAGVPPSPSHAVRDSGSRTSQGRALRSPEPSRA